MLPGFPRQALKLEQGFPRMACLKPELRAFHAKRVFKSQFTMTFFTLHA